MRHLFLLLLLPSWPSWGVCIEKEDLDDDDNHIEDFELEDEDVEANLNSLVHAFVLAVLLTDECESIVGESDHNASHLVFDTSRVLRVHSQGTFSSQ